jgi:hypothetical protein
VADGGRNAARGLRYQYLRTLEALMDAEESGQCVVAVHVEGLPAPDGKAPDSIDYELTGAGGGAVMAAQVKARAPGTVMGAGEAFRALAGLVRDRDADRYALLTSASEGESVRELAALLGAGLAPRDLRSAIGTVLAAVSAKGPQGLLAGLEDEHLIRLDRAVIEFDPRDDWEISESLRWRLRRYRNGVRAGLGDESAGLLIGYLVSEIFRRAASPADATVLVSQFRSAVLVDGASLARALGRRDWGVVVGAVSRAPDVRRADVLERMEGALPARSGPGFVPQCTLTGMSGIGKTSLAVGYLLERADLYDVIFWADAESETALASSFLGIFRYLRGEDAHEPPDGARLRETVLTELSCMAGQWLLILDNCADERLADAWVPKAGGGHVIVTTLDSARPQQGDVRVEVTGMPVAQAVDLLTRRLSPDGPPDGPQRSQLVRLARELEGWPLALELASAYLHRGGYSIGGIPEYLERLKLPSLGHRESVPRGYPRTLISAVDLCLERIRQAADEPESDSGWAATAALGVLRIAAYMSSRRIPVYLVMSVPAFDIEREEAFQGSAPVVADHPGHPPAEVVGVLRAYSLAAADEPLPPQPAGNADSRRYDYTITVTSVLQDVMRHRYGSDLYTGMIVDRLAWHTERWMKAAFELGAHERALALAAHAAAIEEHASRANLTTDFIAFLRGNLASVEFRQNKNGRVIRLLRSEIEHYRGRGEEHARLLTCQASTQLAAVLADEDHAASLEEITSLLETAYFYLAAFASENPEGTAFLLSPARSVLRHLELAGVSDERLARLAAALRDLDGRLPETPYSAAFRMADEIEACMHEHRDCRRAADLARALLASAVAADDSQESAQLRAKVRRSLIEALAVQHDMKEALAELGRFTADTQPPSVFVREIQDMLHNTGFAAALFSMTYLPGTAELLAALLSDGRAGLVRASYPGETADRVGLLCGVSSFHQGDLPAACERLEEFLRCQSRCESGATAQQGWRKLAGLLADAIVARKDKKDPPAPFAFRLLRESGLGCLLRFAPGIQNLLAFCEVEALPLITALAIIHHELSGAPGARSVTACWQLHGALGHLGFNGEVIAAARTVLDGDSTAEHIGSTQRAPSLGEDGSTDGHAVFWAGSFGILVDPAIVLGRHIRAVARGDPLLSFPVMLPVPDRETLFGPDLITSSSRPSLNVTWGLMPHWTQALTPVPGSDLDASLEAGKITLAHATLDVIRELDGVRTDLTRMRARYPTLAALLDGRSQLPAPLATRHRTGQPNTAYTDGTTPDHARRSKDAGEADTEQAF